MLRTTAMRVVLTASRSELPADCAAAHSGEAALPRRRESDSTAEVMKSRTRHHKSHAKTDVDCEWLERTTVCNRTEKHGTPELGEMPSAAHQHISRSPRRTISSYTLERVVTTIVSRSAHESM